MVRIINQEQARLPQTEQPVALSEKSKVLLQVLGIVIADRPKTIRTLLEDYSISFDKAPSEKELVDTMLSAVGECNPEFNSELAGIILDCTLESDYDSFDIKSLFSKNAGSEGGDAPSGGAAAGGGGGLWAGIANAVGSVGGAIGQGLKGRQAREQATASTLQGMYAYKSQQAATEQGKSKNKTYLLLSILAVVGLAITALVLYSRKQQAQAQTPAPLPLNASA